MNSRNVQRNGHRDGRHRDAVAAPERGDEEAQAAGAQLFQGVQGGRPPAERAGEQLRRRRRNGRGGEPTVVPEAEFRSYYGRPVLKPPVWKHEIPAYLFTGGLAAGTTVLAAGADLTGRTELRRACRLGGLTALVASTYLLIADLGRPDRFHHMLRVVKPTSPMSVGTWILSAFAPGAGAAAVSELIPQRWAHTWPARLLTWLARPLGLTAAATAPGLASYTAVLLSHTAVPGWNEVRDELPFVFTGSAAASGGGFGMLTAPLEENGPARVFAAVGTVQELVASRVMEHRMGLVREAYEHGQAHRLGVAAEALNVAGLLGTVFLAGRSRAGAAASGLALLAASALQRFRVFDAGVESTKDPKYVVVPQRERLEATTTA
jgi:formate-dependent nitrite reductase membrane component NrfD